MKPNQASPVARQALEFVIANAEQAGPVGACAEPAGRHRPLPACFKFNYGCSCSEDE